MIPFQILEIIVLAALCLFLVNHACSALNQADAAINEALEGRQEVKEA